MGNRIRQKQTTLPRREDLIVVIKPLPTATYQQVIAALDEMQINAVKQYPFVDASAAEISAACER